MRISALERVFFIAAFVLVAGVCLGFLFGYRYSFDQQRLEKRGVVVFSGAMDHLQMYFREERRVVSLPYVDTNVPPGTHHVMLVKTGYTPFETDIFVDTQEATIIPVELAPQLLTGQKKDFPQHEGTDAQYMSGLGVILHDSTSGTIMTHAENTASKAVYLPSMLRTAAREELHLTRVSDTALLVSNGKDTELFDDTHRMWHQVQLAAGEEPIADQGMLLAYAQKAGTIRYINQETGKPEEKPFLEGVTSVQKSHIVDTQFGDAPMIYSDTLGHKARLQPRWFASPSVESLDDADTLQVQSATFKLYDNGDLVNEKGEHVLKDVRQSFTQKDSVLFVTGDHAVYSIEEGKPVFHTRFSTDIVSIQPQKNNVYSFVQTQQALYFCERKTLTRCALLATGNSSDVERGVDKLGQFLWYVTPVGTLSLVPFFQGS